MFKKVIDSPTLMTWGNFLASTTGLIVLLPLILSRFSPEDVVVWFLFSSLIVIITLFDLGFSPTMIRFVAYAAGGANPDDIKSAKHKFTNIIKDKAPNWTTINLLIGTMHRIYLWLAIVVLVFGGSIGALLLQEPIEKSSNPGDAWIAWGVVILISAIRLYGNIYSSSLNGLNKVALVQRWQMGASLMSVICASGTLLVGGDLLAVVISYQIWSLIIVIINSWQMKILKKSMTKRFEIFSSDIFYSLWPSVWRSGVGVTMTTGFIQLTGVVYANISETSKIASYLFGLQLIRAISGFSQAPFYSKIPVLAKLYAQQDKINLLILAKRGMRLSYLVYVVAALAVALFATPLLNLINSSVSFPDEILWSLLVLAFFIERYGAMHLQLYSMCGHIIWHIVNSVSGVLMVILSIALYPLLDVMAFPLAIILSYLSYYAWYSAIKSYKEYDIKFLTYESTIMLPFLFMLSLGIIFLIK